jgi:hypothetical protein
LIWKGLVCALLATQLAHAASTWLQLEIRVPFEPTAFPSNGRTYLAYELYITNFTADPLTLRRIEVRDADASAANPIAAFEGEQLDVMSQPLGLGQIDHRREIAGGGSVVVFLWLALDPGAHIPNRLSHRVVTADLSAEGAVIGTHHTSLLVLEPPVRGANWLADDGPSNDQDNHHRRGILVIEGRAQISRRYAIDWQQIENGRTFSGDASDLHSYHAYGKPVFAVADGTVVIARDGVPDNVPGHLAAISSAVPITMDIVAGNTIALNIGSGQFAHYMHLLPGSLLVKTGDHVLHGQILARIGDSGDAREPHLHFEITTSAKLLAGEGVPYVIYQYSVRSTNNTSELRKHELPLRGMLIDFGKAQPLLHGK